MDHRSSRGGVLRGDLFYWRHLAADGAIAQSWVPYLAVPFAIGFAAARLSLLKAGVLGALSSLMMLIGFYAVSPFDNDREPVSTQGIAEYAPLGLLTGFLLAALSRYLAPTVSRSPRHWALACCSTLAVALVASWSILGWGVHELATPDGLVTVGESTTDVVVSAVIVLSFSVAAIVYAIYETARPADRRLSTEAVTVELS